MQLNDKQKKFCDEYLLCLNKTEAALNAGYSKSVAEKRAQLWVGKSREKSKYPAMWDYIEERRKKLEEDYDVSQNEVLRGFHRIAAIDIRELFDKDGNMLPVHKMNDSLAGAIAGIEIIEEYTGRGKEKVVKSRIKKLKLGDRNAAWANIAKMLGYNAPDKIEHSAGGSFLDFLKKASTIK